MSDLTLAADVLATGVGATLLMDWWSWLLRRIGISTLDYAMLGRWCGHWLKGRWFHAPIHKSTAVRGEKAMGWALHYLTGIVFAACLLGLTGPQPGLASALLFGALTVLVPWLVLQPALGAGLAAAKTPRPWLSRGIGLGTHLIFACGLFVCAELAAVIAQMP